MYEFRSHHLSPFYKCLCAEVQDHLWNANFAVWLVKAQAALYCTVIAPLLLWEGLAAAWMTGAVCSPFGVYNSLLYSDCMYFSKPHIGQNSTGTTWKTGREGLGISRATLGSSVQEAIRRWIWTFLYVSISEQESLKDVQVWQSYPKLWFGPHWSLKH